jgi:hypothetical protein
MSKYTFTFKKDDIFVEFTTEDRDVIERQFQIWVTAADNYVSSQKPKSAAEKNIEEAKSKMQNAKNDLKTADLLTEKTNLPEQDVVLDKASTLLKTINSIQNEQTEEQGTESAQEAVNSEEEANQEAFEAVLEKTIENPTFEPDRVKDQVFLNLVKSKNTTDKFHYLIITAYYLSEFEKLERFSLKQINTKLMQNLSEVIDHVTLQEALIQNLLELVPDLTGIAEVGEYKLTRLGEEFFANKIG